MCALLCIVIPEKKILTLSHGSTNGGKKKNNHVTGGSSHVRTCYNFLQLNDVNSAVTLAFIPVKKCHPRRNSSDANSDPPQFPGDGSILTDRSVGYFLALFITWLQRGREEYGKSL